MKLLNAFSLNMIGTTAVENPGIVLGNNDVHIEHITVGYARELAAKGLESFVGHPDTAAVFSNILGVPVAFRRETIKIGGEIALVGQLVGPRLPEGAKTLPEGAAIEWFLVGVKF